MKKKEIIIGVTHGGNPHIDDLLSVSILSHFSISNYIPLLVIRSSNIEEILKIIDKIKKDYEINDIYILDQTININELKNFKNIEIKVIDHHDKNTNNCTFQLLLEYLYPEYSLKLLDFDFNLDFSNFNNFDNKKIFKPINFIDKYLKLISISDTDGPIASFQYFSHKNIEINIDELLEFEYFILKNPFIFAILKYFNKKYFFIKSDKNIFYILGNIIIKQLFNNFKIKDLEFETINNNIIIVKSKKRYLDTHILKFTLEYFNLDLNDNIIVIYFKNSNRNSEEYSVHLINICNKKFNITKLIKLIDLKFIHGNHKIIAISKSNYEKFIELLKNYNDLII